jgi:uncharacterized protein (TIGR03435 family)
MRLATVAGLVVSAALTVASAQQPDTRHAFEVVSIKRSAPDAPPGRASLLPGGRYVLQNGPMRVLLGIAYPSPTNEVLNAPDWLTKDNYDVTGLAGPTATFPQVAEMLKAMFADRMQLAMHYEMHERPVYDLVVASSDGKFGPGLRRSSIDCEAVLAGARARNEVPQPPPSAGPVPPCTIRQRPGSVEANAWSMASFAGALRSSAGRVVVDRTGLTGAYDLKLEWAPDPADTTDSRPSLFSALQEELGLKLQASKAPLQIPVIDRIERPTPD